MFVSADLRVLLSLLLDRQLGLVEVAAVLTAATILSTLALRVLGHGERGRGGEGGVVRDAKCRPVGRVARVWTAEREKSQSAKVSNCRKQPPVAGRRRRKGELASDTRRAYRQSRRHPLALPRTSVAGCPLADLLSSCCGACAPLGIVSAVTTRTHQRPTPSSERPDTHTNGGTRRGQNQRASEDTLTGHTRTLPSVGVHSVPLLSSRLST